MDGSSGVHRVLVGKPEGRIPRHRWDVWEIGIEGPPMVYVAKQQKNVSHHSGVKNVARSRMLQKSDKPVEPSSSADELPREVFLCEPQAVVHRDSSGSADSGCSVSSSTGQSYAASPRTSPSHGTVCLQIKEDKNYELLSTEEAGSCSSLDEFRSRQKFMEEQNRQRKELLAKALADRKKQTNAESRRLQQIQDELQKLDVLLSNDVSILRDQIEVASHEFMEAQKRYNKAEQEFLDAKLLLFERLERKELLTEHLCTIIEQNEIRKARKLSELMDRLQLGGSEAHQDTAVRNMILSPLCALDEVSYSVCNTLKPRKVTGESQMCKSNCPPAQIQN
ncbi:RAB6-interacting golgin isoform X1 [Zootermopsis nevadensis]|nr:RAB6-interacting golgin isoform X1 [Zootermopsis nevadensis]